MSAVSIRRNDIVFIRTGKDQGQQGRVLKVMADTNRAIVEGVAKVKRHTKPNPQKGIKGGIVEREGSLDLSNLMLVCPECSKPTRITRKRDDDGKRVRLCKKCNASVDRDTKE